MLQLAKYEDDLQAVITERKRLQQQQFPDLELGDFVVLKNGPQAYKVASHWQILDRNTGELHHHSVTIETWRRRKADNGWFLDDSHSITLANEVNSEPKITRLTTFLAAVLGAHMPNDPGDYLILPLHREGTEVNLLAHNLT
jgi:hypothetical protein